MNSSTEGVAKPHNEAKTKVWNLRNQAYGQEVALLLHKMRLDVGSILVSTFSLEEGNISNSFVDVPD